jgi:HD-GYP domain-containing protein (c-di-GMP phosphodiesterase class II)
MPANIKESIIPAKKLLDKKLLKKLLFSSSFHSVVPITALRIHAEDELLFNQAQETQDFETSLGLHVAGHTLSVEYSPALPLATQEFFSVFLQHLAEQSAKTFRLGRETLEAYKEINSIFEVSKSLSQAHFINDMVQNVIAEFQSIIPSAYISLWLKKPKGKKLEKLDSILHLKKTPFSQSDEKKLMEHLIESYKIADIFSPPYPEFFPKPRVKTSFCLFVPLQVREEPFGGIFLFGSPTGTFRSVELKLANSIALQASFFIQNSILFEEIENLFDAMVRSMVAAIDERDPATSGHSARVSLIAQKLAKAVTGTQTGPYKDTEFSTEELREIKYAGLLHDIGKIGVREEILKKHHRLPAGTIEAIHTRLDFFQLKTERNCDAFHECIDRANQSYMLKDEDFSTLEELSRLKFENLHGKKLPLLKPEEFEQLSIRRGNLTLSEVEEMKKHPEGTGKILGKIPFSKDLEKVPLIASQHHEKMDGTGYPRGLKGKEILLQSQIMCIADIFEALIASDRPYKPPLSREEALKILWMEADRDRIDKNLLTIFQENLDEIAGHRK